MKKLFKKGMAIIAVILLLLSNMITAFAANTPEIDAYLDTAYAKAIDPYGTTATDEDGRYVIPLSKTSVTLKKDSRSQEYTATWTSSDEAYAAITSNYASSATAKITHPTAKEGAKEVILTLTLTDKNDSSKICGTRDFVLLIAPQLPVYTLSVTAKDNNGNPIPNATIMVQDSRNIEQYPSEGVYALKGETEYTLTVSAVGYIRNVQKLTLTEDTDLSVVLTAGTSVTFQVKTASGSSTDYADIQVTDENGTEYNCVLDEYGYDTSLFELKAGTYHYTVTYQSGSQSAAGSFTLSEGQSMLTIPVQLGYTEYKIRFDVDPADAKISLYKNGAQGAYGDPILPDADGYYTIIFGQYRYIIEADGFYTVNKTFNATDTALKNNDYIITVCMESPYDQILTEADNLLFAKSGEGLLLKEYTGLHSDIDFGYYADIDSDYDDINLKDTLEELLLQQLKTENSIQVTIIAVENADYEPDYSVIGQDGTIHYDAVTDNMIDYDESGAMFTASLLLTYENRTRESEVRVLVPKHIFSRQERLDAAADYAIAFDTLKGENIDLNHIQSALHLSDLSEDLVNDFPYYSICTSWVSDHPEIIDPVTGQVTPAEQDTLVTLTVKTYYSAAQLEDAGFLFDPGPLGNNESIRTITLLVPGTKADTSGTEPAKPNKEQDSIEAPSVSPAPTDTIQTPIPKTGGMASQYFSLLITVTAAVVLSTRTIKKRGE